MYFMPIIEGYNELVTSDGRTAILKGCYADRVGLNLKSCMFKMPVTMAAEILIQKRKPFEILSAVYIGMRENLPIFEVQI
jgi:hypothetical protein